MQVRRHSRLLAVLLCFPLLVHAAPYRHAGLGVALALPDGWKVRAAPEGGVRVLPPKMEDRERSGVAVRVWRERLRGGSAALERLASRYRKAQGPREAAISTRLDRKAGRLVLEYREGEYVQNGLWILRQHLRVIQQDGKQAVMAECVANASEYHRYRRAFADLCLGMNVRPLPSKG